MDCGSDDERLAKTLASLVPGAVEGLVREVVVIDRGLDVGTRKVAEHAGCEIVAPEKLRDRIDHAKGEWLLFLEPGARLLPGWMEAIGDHVAAADDNRAATPAARFRRAKADRAPFFARLRQIRTALAEGFLVRREQAAGLIRIATSLEEAARGVAVTRLPADIRPAAPR